MAITKIKGSCFIAMLMVLVSCQDRGAPDLLDDIKPQDPQLIWVANLYIGGRQCDLSDRYTPPDVKSVLNEVGIPVYETEIEYLAVCQACGCPSYAARHYALIDKQHLAKAEQLGFRQKNPPTGG